MYFVSGQAVLDHVRRGKWNSDAEFNDTMRRVSFVDLRVVSVNIGDRWAAGGAFSLVS